MLVRPHVSEAAMYQDLAASLAKADPNGQELAHPFAPLPATLAQGYELCRSTLSAGGEPVAAWKVGGSNTASQAKFQSNSIFFGPLYKREVSFSGRPGEVSVEGVTGCEAEVVLRLRPDYRSSTLLVAENVFDVWTVGLECPDSRFPSSLPLSLPLLVGDRCGAGRLVLATELYTDFEQCNDVELKIVVDGGEVTGAANSLLGLPVSIGLEFVEMARYYGFDLKAGQWVATGGATPYLPLESGKAALLKWRV